MKKLTVILILLFAIGTSYGQKALRTTAFNHLRKGQLEKAMQTIEPTISDASTMNDPKTWLYRGNIYLQIHMSEQPEIKNLDADALNKAYKSYLKMQELDTKKTYTTEAIQNLLVISEQLYNEGVANFSKEDYEAALGYFERSVEVNKSFNNIDTLAIFNAGLSAENAQNYPKAKEYYTRIVELNYPQPLVYSSLSNVYLAEKDTTGAFEIIRQGREKYGEDFNLLIAETNLYLATGESEKAMNNLQEAVKTDPLNPTIHYAVGVNYALMNNVDEAEKSYLKAVELKPDYFEANYNLGALYVNKAAEIINEANLLKLNDPNYDVLKNQADDILKTSIPYLESATAADPTDKSTLLALKEIYARLSMFEKLKEVNAKLEGL